MRNIIGLLTLLLALVVGFAEGQEASDEGIVVHGHVVAFCLTCQLNKFTQLKSFLKDGEAECYHNVTVEYKHTTRLHAMLEVTQTKQMEDGTWMDVGVETIDLTEYDNKDALHELFTSKGFVRKTDTEVALTKLKNLLRRKEEVEDKKRKLLESPLARKKYTEAEMYTLAREHDEEVREIEQKMDSLIVEDL